MTGNRPDWDMAYANKSPDTLSWHEDLPLVPLDLTARTGLRPDHAVLDVGAGASPLLIALANKGFTDLTALELSSAALAALKARLPEGTSVNAILSDVCTWHPSRRYDLWHDRAVLHFLTGAEDQAAYVETLKKALKPKGHAIIGAFAPDGPDKCFGQPIQKYDATRLMDLLGPAFTLIEERRHDHYTPGGTLQRYFYALARYDG